MTRPRGSERPVSAPFLTLDLAEATRKLEGEEAWKTRRRNAVTLLKDEGLRIVLVVLHENETIESHCADGPISIHLLEGALRLTVGGEDLALEPGQVLTLERKLEHDVRAQKKSTFLLTLGGKAAHPVAP